MPRQPRLAHPAERGGLLVRGAPYVDDDDDGDDREHGDEKDKHGRAARREPAVGSIITGAAVCRLCRSAQARIAATRKLSTMPLLSIKAVVAAGWVTVILVIGIALQLSSVTGWGVLASIALLPPVAMLWLWNVAEPVGPLAGAVNAPPRAVPPASARR
jgi:hypothetical protein